MSLPPTLLARLADRIGPISAIAPAPGGSHRSYRLQAGGQGYFCKFHPTPPARIFQVEAEGLEAMRAAANGVFVVPDVVDVVETSQGGYLLLEWLTLVSRGDDARLAEALAMLHSTTSDRFGWSGHGYLGLVPHPNTWRTPFAKFFVESRLLPHMQAARRGLDRKTVANLERLATRCADIFADTPPPSLVHGDFWGGNHGYLADGTPAFFDPSPAWAIPAYDLGFSRSFGSFSSRFYDAYRSATGTDLKNLEAQTTACEVVIMLAHVTMFGGSYAGRVGALTEALI